MASLIEKTLGREAMLGRIKFSPEPMRAISGSFKTEVIEEGERAEERTIPYLSLSLYREFSEKGNRTDYETPFFDKRRSLSQLVTAECVENESRFIKAIEEYIWSIISEPSWTIPAHNTYIRDTATLNTPLIGRPILDLFACETGEILSLTLSLLNDKLDETLKSDIEHVLRERILLPYTTDHFWWMGNDGPLNNWTPWCTQNVLLSLLTLSLSEKESRKILKTAVSSLDAYINSMPEDGGCDEGASYYHAAAVALWGALHILELSTHMDFSPIFRDSKIKAMAEYIECVHVKDDTYLNYADCSPKAGTLTAREYLFGKAVGSVPLMHHAALDASKYWKESDNNYNLFYRYLAIAHYDEIKEEARKPVDVSHKSFAAFRNTGLVIYRDDDIVFAIKGGNNGESHNHNDAGSITLYKDGKPCLIDIGVETYTKTTFSKDRYTLFPMRSTYHNVVNFPPLEQHDGEAFRAEIIEMDENETVLDLTNAYESGKGLKKYIRRAFFDREKREIRISEDFSSEQKAVLSLMTVEMFKADGNKLEAEHFSITFPEDVDIKSETIKIEDARLRKAWPDKLYRTLITLHHCTTWTIKL
ncbi:MAG: heparinase II/III family protein [Spirochaetes bacterium]|uniref:Heparinase II/III family protein n=1 Tax=Candidatus Ornithospirochaeta stercoripullorum TaxID=2840899 RepID=A0A9D9DZL1_9SPIO|nr:heparinase II/III family protein [Candidatus Ornithospirochaeta stercoripullorum]